MVLIRLLAFSLMCFVFVSCYQNKLLFRRHSINYETIGNHEFGTQKFYNNLFVNTYAEENCRNQNYSRAWKTNINYFKCLPREAIVHLHSHQLNVQMFPDKIVVKRCYESGCSGGNSCLPSKTKDVKVAINLDYKVERKQRCSWLTVTEHTECKCGCQVTKQECERVNKKFSAKECLCKCKNENEKWKCQKQENMEWKEESCSCMCKMPNGMECSTGATWVPKFCKCMKVMNDENLINYNTV